MYKFICWLDEDGKRIFHTVIFQLCVSAFLIVILPTEPKSIPIFWFLLAGLTAAVVILAISVDRGWQLVLGLSALALFETVSALYFVLAGKLTDTDVAYTILAMILVVAIFASLSLFVATRRTENEKILPPTH